jgi:predicted permease
VPADVGDELQFHLDMRSREYEEQGMTPDAARRAALARFGDVAGVDAELRSHDHYRDRDSRRRMSLATVAFDLRYAMRTLWRAPGFTIAAVLCLGLGTGATAAVFAVVVHLVFRPLPVVHPSNLVVVGTISSGNTLAGDNSYPNYLDIRNLRGVLSDAAAATSWPVSLRVGERPERGLVQAVSDNFWPMLGMPMVRGRAFSPEEARARERLLVISYGFWQREFNGSPDAVGHAVVVNGLPMTIVGIAPRDFQGTQPELSEDGWIPVTLLHDIDPYGLDYLNRRAGGGFKILGRLRDGVTLATARRNLDLLAKQLARQYPAEDEGERFVIERELRARPDIAVATLIPQLSVIFMALTALVLLIACANVASLMLARAAGRSTELAVRTALGARRSRLVRQLLTESLVLALLGGVVGIAIAEGAARWLRSLEFASTVPVHFQVTVDWRVLAIGVASALCAAVLSGLGPALRASRPAVGDALKEESRGAAGGASAGRLRSFLVAAQVAVAFIVLVPAGLFVRSLRSAAALDLGFRQDHGLLANVDVSLARYDTARGQRFFQALVSDAGRLAGVRHAALASSTPLGTSHSGVSVYADVPSLTAEHGHTHIEILSVTPEYFDALGIPLLRGRDFTIRDDSAAGPVMIVNAAAAARLWPGQDPVGKRVRFKPSGPEEIVVGVVKTVTSTFIGEQPRAVLYVPFAQRYASEMTLHLATEGDPARLAGPVRNLVGSLDPNLAPYAVRTMYSHLHDGIAFLPVRLGATLAMAIAILGLLQAVIGLYGVVAYAVAQRTREIGIRMAMGATAHQVLWDVVRRGMVLTGCGLVTGVALALLATRILRSALIGVSAQDPVTFITLAALLSLVTFAACLVPAWRAARVPPAGAIRA